MSRPARDSRAEPVWVAGAVALVAVVGLGVWAVEHARRKRGALKERPDMPTLAGGRGSHVERTVTILRTPAELYAEWRDLERLPEIMSHVESVTPLVGLRSRWVVRGPGDTRVAWEAEIVADEPDRLIAWRTVSHADVEHAGSVRFTSASGDRGTEVKVILTYAPPAGRVGAALATLLGRSPDQDVREDLRRFKQRMEATEIPVAPAPRESQAPALTRRS
jgi:uncharacterized membrane protein